MKIEGVIVCVEYSDFLAHTLKENQHQFDKLVVVTDSADHQTQAICRHRHVECVVTDAFYANDAAFNKGRGINAGLARLKKDGFVVHMDADIILPPRTKLLLSELPLDPKKIYGIDRMMCTSFESWMRYVAKPEIQHEGEAFVTANAFPLGSRLAWTNHQGYLPVGFFQMWSPAGSGVVEYPTEHGEAARADVAFSLLWPRNERELIPEIIAIHLESQKAPSGINWRGRRTRSFDLDGCETKEQKAGHISTGSYENLKR